MYLHKSRLSLYAIFTLAALIILVDFISPGTIINDEIINVQRELQQYNNAAGSSHYSFKVITNEHEFLVTEDFTKLKLVNKNIEYSVSRIFKEVNWYRLLLSENKSFSSLRIVSGLILPLLAIISMFITYRYKKEMGLFIFILQVVLIADLIFLIT